MDQVGHVDLVGLVRVRCRLSGRLVAFLEFYSQFMRISAGRCVCCVCGMVARAMRSTDPGARAAGHPGGYVRVTSRL